ncbi:BirA family transcriptional regulator, biotin operon repressor / biotin-[acetyl-CoA-carboxylase] ligase [Chitinophaga eiseniae]|uniref:BirA family transcriptional regulator, biotin operon repressor / biotin-[acetyl-CoA-carboxylase] ligase n=1 Tax=Chitinophaga eiseniae TaxID=634771 RepID=A0A1T4R740_9BACT|nr:biotin--[acetyl-CoA-carboxylase] ligase [Chitinophaga eiseniae]SKA11441.1 BirA family transcriptional regulator, biotin operon repressor / biotin-[acetyl-CoA-carboxylase] ligase [Chitinophaga eiseniae]
MVGHPFYILDEIDSTNNYAMERVNSGQVTSGTAWFTSNQTAGKGTRGKQWVARPGDIIALSIALQPAMLPLSRQFMLSMAVALGTHDFFSAHAGDETVIKWPNDIYWRDRKAGGILIENVLRGNMWHYAIIGIGLNLNQGKFPEHLPNAVSLKQITGKNWDAVTLAQELCRYLDARIRTLQMSALDTLLAEYTSKLFRWQQPGLYRKDGVVFQGIIRDVLPDGHLCLEREGEILRLGFGEVEFVLGQ